MSAGNNKGEENWHRITITCGKCHEGNTKKPTVLCPGERALEYQPLCAASLRFLLGGVTLLGHITSKGERKQTLLFNPLTGGRTDPSSALSQVSTGQLMDSSAEITSGNHPHYTAHHSGYIQKFIERAIYYSANNRATRQLWLEHFLLSDSNR